MTFKVHGQPDGRTVGVLIIEADGEKFGYKRTDSRRVSLSEMLALVGRVPKVKEAK